MKTTWKKIKAFSPCGGALVWGQEKFGKKKEIEQIDLIKALMKADKSDWANWLIVRFMTHKQKVRYAIFAAEQVIEIYEKKHPNDDRPRKAIQAAKDYLAGKIDKKAAYAAAYAAANAAYAAADAAANAAYAAADAAAYAAAYAAYAARKKLRIKILNFGIKILREGEKDGKGD